MTVTSEERARYDLCDMLALLLAATLATTSPSIAGDYFQGDGLGVNWTLTLDTDHTFLFKWRGCLGQYASAYGKWTEHDGILQLTITNQSGSANAMPLTYRIFRWDERIYLVDNPAKFAEWVNRGWEPRSEEHGLVFLRSPDWNRPVDGIPALPPEFAKLILQRPVRARIIEAQGHRGTIDVGSKDGVMSGLLLTLHDGCSFDNVRVVHTSQKTAIVEGKRDLPKNGHLSSLEGDKW